LVQGKNASAKLKREREKKKGEKQGVKPGVLLTVASQSWGGEGKNKLGWHMSWNSSKEKR